MQYPEFIKKEEAISIHSELIGQYGGSLELLDEGLLESALYQPQASFSGEFLHQTIYEQAAAYLFHLAKNHAFQDGNKRTAFAVMVTFLNKNDYELALSPQEAYELTMQVVNDRVSKEELCIVLKNCITKLI